MYKAPWSKHFELPKTPGLNAYVIATTITMSAYTLVLLVWLVARFTDFPISQMSRGGVRVATFVCALGILVHAWTILRLMNSSDEFMRSLMAKRLLIAAFVTLGGATIWALLENVGWLGSFPLIFIYLVFFTVHAAIIPFINADRP